MTTRTAQCGCGRAKITVANEPVLVGACHCDFCQKRTGSLFGVQAYFSEGQCVETGRPMRSGAHRFRATVFIDSPSDDLVDSRIDPRTSANHGRFSSFDR